MSFDELLNMWKGLQQEFPRYISLETIGTTEAGNEIWVAHVGEEDCDRNALFIGVPHPLEVIGTLASFARAAYEARHPEARNPYRVKKHFVLAGDIDGYPTKPIGSLLDFASNYFRPSGAEQLEWAFPGICRDPTGRQPDYVFSEERMPRATRALRDLIRQLQPEFVSSQHNSHLEDGLFVYSSGFGEVVPPIDVLAAVHKIPLAASCENTALSNVIAPGMFGKMSMRGKCLRDFEAGRNPREFRDYGFGLAESLETEVGPKGIQPKVIAGECPTTIVGRLKNPDEYKPITRREAIETGWGWAMDLWKPFEGPVERAVQAAMNIGTSRLLRATVFQQRLRENFRANNGLDRAEFDVTIDERAFGNAKYGGDPYFALCQLGQAAQLVRNMGDLNTADQMRAAVGIGVEYIESHVYLHGVSPASRIGFQLALEESVMGIAFGYDVSRAVEMQSQGPMEL